MAAVTSPLDAFMSTPEQAPAQGNSLDAFMASEPAPKVVAKPPQQAVQTPEGSKFGPLGDPLFWSDIGTNIGQMGQAIAHNAMNLPHGGAQLVEHGIAKAANALPANPVSSYINKEVAADDAAMQAREASYQQSVPNNAATYTGAAIGQTLPFLLGGPLQKGLQAVGKAGSAPFEALASKTASLPIIPSVLKAAAPIAGGAAQGAVIGASTPVSNTGDFGSQKETQVGLGALAGGAAPIVAAAPGAVWRGLKGVAAPFLNPKSIAQSAVGRIAGKEAPSIAAKLSSAQELVPGSIPTAAQAAPTPEMVQLEKTLSNNPELKPLFVQRAIDNNAARIAAVQSVAGPPGALQAAIDERSRIGKNLYDWAFEHQEPVSPWMKGQVTQLTKRPAIQQAMKQARTLAANDGVKFTNATSIQGLHYVKTALDDQIDSAMRQGNSNEARILMGTKDKLLTFMEKLSPTYAQARQEFAQASVPVNTMEVANDLLDKLNTGSFDASGRPTINYSGYKTALSRALNNSDYAIDPKAQQVLQNVQNDLQRATASNAVRTPGSDTAFNLQAPGWLAHQIYGENFSGPTRMGRILGMVLGSSVGEAVMPGHTLAALAVGGGTGLKLGERIGTAAAKNVNAEMADAFLNPQKFAALLAARQQVQPSAFQGLLSSRAPQMAGSLAARNPQSLMDLPPAAQ